MLDLRLRRFPNIHTACLSDFVQLKQGKNTAFGLYREMDALLRGMKRDPNQFTNDYIAKLKHPEVRLALSTASYDGMDLAQMAQHADKVERTLGLVSATTGTTQSKKGGDATISTNKRSANKQGNTRGGRSNRRGRGGRNGGATGGRGASRSNAGGPNRGKDGLPQKLVEQFQQMEAWGVQNNCFGCLGAGHRYEHKNPSCDQKRCVFCGRDFSAKGSHPSVRCFQRPKTKEDLHEFWKSKKNDKNQTNVKKNVSTVMFEDAHQTATDTLDSESD